MFGMDRRGNFLSSLISSGAGEFAQRIEQNVGRIANAPTLDNINLPETAESLVNSVPDMILPEDQGLVGGRIMDGIEDYAPSSIRSGTENTANIVRNQATPQITQDEIAPSNGIPDDGHAQDILPAREMMRRRLNHFQVEQLAERIKERLESEMRIERERRGEGPE